MDEYSADPFETEREAQSKLSKIKFNKARAEVSKIADEVKAEKAAANEYKKYPGLSRPAGGAGSDELVRAINKPFKDGGMVKSASKRADGIAIRGKTRA